MYKKVTLLLILLSSLFITAFVPAQYDANISIDENGNLYINASDSPDLVGFNRLFFDMDRLQIQNDLKFGFIDHPCMDWVADGVVWVEMSCFSSITYVIGGDDTMEILFSDDDDGSQWPSGGISITGGTVSFVNESNYTSQISNSYTDGDTTVYGAQPTALVGLSIDVSTPLMSGANILIAAFAGFFFLLLGFSFGGKILRYIAENIEFR